MITIEQVSKKYRNSSSTVEALKNVSLQVDKGDIFGVIGFSGAGKSTLIRLVNQLEKPDSGRVIVNNQEVNHLSEKSLNKLRKQIGMVFQQFNLLQSKTVYQNIAIPLIISGYSKDDIEQRVTELLAFVELEDKKDTYVTKLSGGQKQRVGIARALATNPSILLCDEATSALDPRTTQSILSLLKKINQEWNVTILLITHEMNVIRDICNKVAVMENGTIIEQGSVLDIFSNPQQQITKDFVKTVMNDEIPENMRKNIIGHNKNSQIIRLQFLGRQAEYALLADIHHKFSVNSTILFASVNELQNTILGVLIIQVVGEVENINLAKQYIEQTGVACREVELEDGTNSRR